jgi:hypothetical protein
MGSLFVLFGYFAPDVLLPVASALAGVVGFVMMVGRAPFRFARRGIRGAARGVRTIAKGRLPQASRSRKAP